jgi:predicted Zn finger-like uncharacterized protein
MQATCPKCAHKVVVDDAKAPDRAFSVKCPKCQTPVKFAGKGAAAPAAAAAPATEPMPVAVAAPSAGAEAQDMRAGMMAQLRREMGLGGSTDASLRALVALADAGQAAALSQALTRLGLAVEGLEEASDAVRLLEQGVYSVVVTAMNMTAGKGETIQQRVARLNPEGRRRVFLALVGDEFKTGDGTQAFAAMADLVISGRDAANAESALRNTMAERTRLYQMFSEARRRFEAAAV